MEIEPDEEFRRIEAAVRACAPRAAPWTGTVYRSSTPRYAGARDMVSGVGSARMGGRWNPRASFPTVYASLEPETAMSESMATFRYYGLPPNSALPRLFRAIEVTQKCVKFCLTQAERRSMLPTMRGHTNDTEHNLSGAGQAVSRSLKQIRDSIGLTQPELARLLGVSTRWVSMQEASPADALQDRKVAEIVRLLEALSQVVRPKSIRAWLGQPNAAFDGFKPVEVIERGEIDRLWRMIFYLESGVPS